MIDIRTEELYIKKLYRTMESRLPKRYLPLGAPRQDDAFIYTISGNCKFELADGSSFISQAGEVMYLARGVDYSMDILTDEYRYILCVFSFDTDQQCQSMLICPGNPTVFDGLFRKLVKRYSVVIPGHRQACMALMYQICMAIARSEQEEYAPCATRLRIEEARAYIQSNISDPTVRVAQIAKQAKMSEVHFRNLFTSLYRMSPSSFILHERVKYAQELMTLREMRLEDIAVQSGFSSLPHMCKVFKSVTGMSPGAYRASMKI